MAILRTKILLIIFSVSNAFAGQSGDAVEAKDQTRSSQGHCWRQVDIATGLLERIDNAADCESLGLPLVDEFAMPGLASNGVAVNHQIREGKLVSRDEPSMDTGTLEHLKQLATKFCQDRRFNGVETFNWKMTQNPLLPHHLANDWGLKRELTVDRVTVPGAKLTDARYRSSDGTIIEEVGPVSGFVITSVTCSLPNN